MFKSHYQFGKYLVILDGEVGPHLKTTGAYETEFNGEGHGCTYSLLSADSTFEMPSQSQQELYLLQSCLVFQIYFTEASDDFRIELLVTDKESAKRQL